MAASREGIPALVWLEPAQRGLVEAIARRAGLAVIAAGAPGGAELGWRLPDGSPAAPITDLRQALATLPIKAALLAATPATGDAPLTDTDVLRAARPRGIRALSIEPIPSSVAESRAAEAAAWADSCRTLALFRDLPALATIDELLAAFGAPRTLAVSFRSGPGHGRLGARLFDAMHTAHSILGTPESIDASVITPVARSGVRMEPGDSLRSLRGDLTANLRYAGARAASLSLSDRAGRWFRGVALVGEGGCVRMDEQGVERIDEFGQTIEKQAPPRKRAAPAGAKNAPLFDEPADAAATAALAQSAARALDPRAPLPIATDLEAVLSMCEAAILSARTGQPESPGTVVRMAS
jgi:hypothetical protein